MTHRKLILIFLIALFALVLAVPTAIQLYTDWLWFGELGYTGVLKTRVVTKLLLGLLSGLIAFGAFWLNFAIARRVCRSLDLAPLRDLDESNEILIGMYADKVAM